MTKKKSSTQEAVTKAGLMPRLRFPEFVGSGEWVEKRLGDDFDFLSTATNSRADLSETGDTFYIHYGDIHTKFNTIIDFSKNSIPMILRSKSKRAQYIQEGDIVLADASEDVEGVGKVIEAINIHKHSAIAGLHTFLLHKKNNNFAPIFCAYMFQCAHIRRQFAKIATGTKVYSISKTTLREVSIYNLAVKEQQRIADCLSCLDTIITSQEQKIKNLEDHKTSLMQKLFPKLGERVPVLRFKEFMEGGEWENKVLKTIASSVTERTTINVRVLSLSSEYGIVAQDEYFGRNLAGENTSRHIKVCYNDFIYNDRVTKASKYGTIKRLTLYDEGIVSPIYKCFRFNDDEQPSFWSYYFECGTHEAELSNFVNEGARAGRFNISVDKFLSIFVLSPKTPEQQRIADCLSSFDELIAAHRKKLNLLKEHKKGLMQGLFPVGRG